ncbi:glucokinase [Lysobacter enzymogenes]|uniref:glucokinase n=1 Tax=Lysobacter enzymogenes TaxID=69 RepID=UPI001AF22F52|nr:glucokinase [Lysobacter enzymogenes]QQQ01560.1 glucokinase [Lysobacter enzymogenes]
MSAAPRLSPAASAEAGSFIAADVGGTHTRVGLVRPGQGGDTVAVLAHRKYVCADYPSLAPILSAFLAEFTAGNGIGVERVVIACAGVVLEDRVVNSNLPWPISLSELRAELGLREVLFINDFQANANAAQCMAPDDSTLLTPGVRDAAPGPVLVIGPGTGLGAAIRIPHGRGTVVLPTEAGHTAFAPGNAREVEMLRLVQQRGHDYVKTEHFVSGPGLVNLYDSLCTLAEVEPALRAPAAITEAARRGDAIAREAVLTFCALLGSVIGDLVVISGAKSVFIAGGILPQLKDFVPDSPFHARMLDKGVMRPVLETVPVRLIENERLGVIGAASWYLEHARDAHGDAARPIA